MAKTYADPAQYTERSNVKGVDRLLLANSDTEATEYAKVRDIVDAVALNYDTASAIQLLRIHNPDLVFQGFIDTDSPLPSIHVENNAWIVTESGTIFGISADKGDIIFSNGTSYVAESVVSIQGKLDTVGYETFPVLTSNNGSEQAINTWFRKLKIVRNGRNDYDYVLSNAGYDGSTVSLAIYPMVGGVADSNKGIAITIPVGTDRFISKGHNVIKQGGEMFIEYVIDTRYLSTLAESGNEYVIDDRCYVNASDYYTPGNYINDHSCLKNFNVKGNALFIDQKALLFPNLVFKTTGDYGTADTTHKSTPLIDIEAFSKLVWYPHLSNLTNAGLAFYDSNKIFISGNPDTLLKNYNIIDIPFTAKYVAVTCLPDDVTDFFLLAAESIEARGTDSERPVIPHEYYYSEFKNYAENLIDGDNANIVKIQPSQYTVTGALSRGTGTINTDGVNYVSTDYINLNGAEYVKYLGFNSPFTAAVCFYDGSNNLLQSNSVDEVREVFYISFAPPAAEKVRFCRPNDVGIYPKLKYNNENEICTIYTYAYGVYLKRDVDYLIRDSVVYGVGNPKNRRHNNFLNLNDRNVASTSGEVLHHCHWHQTERYRLFVEITVNTAGDIKIGTWAPIVVNTIRIAGNQLYIENNLGHTNSNVTLPFTVADGSKLYIELIKDTGGVELKVSDGKKTYHAPKNTHPWMIFAGGLFYGVDTADATFNIDQSFLYNPSAEIMFQGDSYVEGVSLFDDQGFYGDVDKKFSNLIATDLGIDNVVVCARGGERADFAIYRYPYEFNLFPQISYIFILYGINDPDYDAWLSRMEYVIELAIQNGVEPILCTIPPNNNTIEDQQNSWVKASGYRYIDIEHLMSTNGVMDEGATLADGIHPTVDMHAEIANEIRRVVPELYF